MRGFLTFFQGNEQLNQSEVTAQTSGSPFVNSESVLSNNNDQIKQDQNNKIENLPSEKTTQITAPIQQVFGVNYKIYHSQ